MNGVKRFVGVVLMALSLASCSNRVGTEWREEVLLSSGEVIIVKRTAAANAFRELGGPSGVRKLAMSVTVESSKTAPPPPPLDFSFVPLIFDYDAERKEWFVVASFYMCDVWYELGKPDLPYLEFRVRDGKWQQVPLGTEHFGRRANMLVSPDLGNESGLVTREHLLEQNKNASDYLKVINATPHDHC